MKKTIQAILDQIGGRPLTDIVPNTEVGMIDKDTRALVWLSAIVSLIEEDEGSGEICGMLLECGLTPAILASALIMNAAIEHQKFFHAGVASTLSHVLGEKQDEPTHEEVFAAANNMLMDGIEIHSIETDLKKDAFMELWKSKLMKELSPNGGLQRIIITERDGNVHAIAFIIQA